MPVARCRYAAGKRENEFRPYTEMPERAKKDSWLKGRV
jgi:hypothetical protein